jgi:hypothetical protein
LWNRAPTFPEGPPLHLVTPDGPSPHLCGDRPQHELPRQPVTLLQSSRSDLPACLEHVLRQPPL